MLQITFFITLALTVILLVAGLILFLVGGDTYARYSNSLMRLRVVSQGITLLLFCLLLLYGR